MLRSEEILVIVPARSGSKRIANKNTAVIGGKPLINYTFDHIQQMGMHFNAVVTSDCSKVLSIAKLYGLKCISRPVHLATDGSTSESAILHALDSLSYIEKVNYSWVLLLQPTSPFRSVQVTSQFLDSASDLSASYDSFFSVIETRDEIWDFDEDASWRRIHGKNGARNQWNRRPLYIEDGSLYLVSKTSLIESGSILGFKPLPLQIPVESGFDINTPYDLKVARALADFNVK